MWIYPKTFFLVGVCNTDSFWPPMFFHLPKVWSISHHGSLGLAQSKKCHFMFSYIFWAYLLFFIIKFGVFVTCISFLDEVSNYRNRILTNQKKEYVIRNFQRNWEIKIWSTHSYNRKSWINHWRRLWGK